VQDLLRCRYARCQAGRGVVKPIVNAVGRIVVDALAWDVRTSRSISGTCFIDTAGACLPAHGAHGLHQAAVGNRRATTLNLVNAVGSFFCTWPRVTSASSSGTFRETPLRSRRTTPVAALLFGFGGACRGFNSAEEQTRRLGTQLGLKTTGVGAW
jgi:hypothetical protein